MPTGYSGKSLADKLGIKPGAIVHAVAAPPDYAALLDPLPEDVTISVHSDSADLQRAVNKNGQATFVHNFVTSGAALATAAPILAASLAPGGMLWVSWPKLAAAKKLSLACDVSEETLRELLLPTGLVDVKVCAVSEVWSGLKFLWRKSS